MTRHPPRLALLAALTLATGPQAGETVTVVTKAHRFEPAEITVKVGTIVRWENRERVQYHDVTFPDLGERPGDYFFPGETRERSFDRPGTFPYVCQPHLESHRMQGVVHVVE